MSVSLALVPVALALRIVMGKNNFNNWAESMQVKLPTSFVNKLELSRTVLRAGYDCEKWGGLNKTHIDGENLMCFWELIDGKWTAVLPKSGSKALIRKFIADINRAAGRMVIEQSQERKLDMNRIETEAETVHSPTFPTNFRDGELLFKTLKEFGVNPVRQGDSFACKVEDSMLIFHQTQDAPFHVEIQNAPDLGRIFEYLSDLDDDYKRCLQSIVYEKLKERAAEKNLIIESEEVLEDNSIVLTLNIRG